MLYRPLLCCLTKNKTNPAYVGAQIGAARLAKALNCELVFYTPEKPEDLGEQSDLLEQAIASTPDAILISPVHSTGLNPQLKRARDAGIPLIFFITDAVGITPISFVTSNNYTLAVDIAHRLFDEMGGSGRVAIIEGLASSPTSPPRTQGFLDAAADYPGINIVATQSGNYQRPDAFLAMKDILKQHPQIDGVLAANDFMALGALEALEQAGRTALTVGMNAVPAAVRAIKDGKLLATVSYDALSLICTALHAAVHVIRGGQVPALLELPAEIIDASNCDAWTMPYEERPLPDWTKILHLSQSSGGSV